MKISKKKKELGLFNPKIRYLDQNVFSVAREHTDTQIDRHTHKREYRGYHFRVSGISPLTYHQGSVQ